jgi:hypothetical protein
MEYRENDQLLLASEFVRHTNKNIFLTGRAGTGKTTFLHNLKKITPKRMVVVAPTGVAAINAGGVTIHSFFQLSFAPAVPGTALSRDAGSQTEGFIRKFSREKINLIKCIDLLVIDEISMVRADVLDAVDEVLRKYRDHSRPFGGVQLLMIGDLHQLSPVIRESEWIILKEFYKSVYFFDSMALKKTNPVTIELKEIFRQSDASFISLLNKVRENKIDTQVIGELNSRYTPGFVPDENEGYITLTTHNANAFEINQARLARIDADPKVFRAVTEGEFPAYNYPTENELVLKPQAQVMFIKNDLSPEKQYYNGKIGKITRIDDEAVHVKCDSDNTEIEVGRVLWENVKYTLDERTREIKEEIVGTFTQIPLRLAWAITIHKSQGLTFDRMIVDANAAFAFGQVYVALSRCRTFSGIVLSTPIAASGIKTDAAVLSYSNEARQNQPGPGNLSECKHNFQKELVTELFDFRRIRYRLENLLKLVNENSNIPGQATVQEIKTKRNDCETGLFQPAEKFKLQLANLFLSPLLPEENEGLQERIRQASAYFCTTIKTHLSTFLEKLNPDTDNKALRKLLNETREKFEKEIFIKLSCLENCKDGFETISYIRTRANAELDFRPSARQKAHPGTRQPESIIHPELYADLRRWRNNLADQDNIPAYMILPQKSIIDLMHKLPTTLPGLKAIKGIGQAKIKQFGVEIVDIISRFCTENEIIPPQVEIPAVEKRIKVSSGKISFEMFSAGKTIPEIAMERKIAPSTVEGHLAEYIGSGQLKINDFVSSEKLEKVSDYISQNPVKTMGEIKSAMGEMVTYGELKFILQHLRLVKS